MGHRYEVAALAADALLFNRDLEKHLKKLDEIRDEVDAKILDIFQLRRRLERYRNDKTHGKLVRELLRCWSSRRTEERSKGSRSPSRSKEDTSAKSSKSRNREDSTSKSSRSRKREDFAFRARSSKSTTSGRDAYSRGNRDRCPPRRSPRRSTRSPSRNWTRRSPIRRQPYNSDFPEVISSTTVSSSISLREHPLKAENKPVPYSYKIPEWKTPEKIDEKEEVDEKGTESSSEVPPHTEDKPVEPVKESSKGLSEFEWRQVFAYGQAQDTVVSSPVSTSLAPFELPRYALPVARIGPPVEKPIVSKEAQPATASSTVQITKPVDDVRLTRSAVFNGALPPGCLERAKENTKIKMNLKTDINIRPLPAPPPVVKTEEKAAPNEEPRTSGSSSMRQTRSSASTASESAKHPEDPVPKAESGSSSVSKESKRIKIPIKPKVPPLPKPKVPPLPKQKVATPMRAIVTAVSPTLPKTRTVTPRGVKLSTSTISTRQTRSSTSNALLQQQTAVKIEEEQGTPSAPANEANSKLPVKMKIALPISSPTHGTSLKLAADDAQKVQGIAARPTISPIVTGTKPSDPAASFRKSVSTVTTSQASSGSPAKAEKNIENSSKVEEQKASAAAETAPTAEVAPKEVKKPQEAKKAEAAVRAPAASRVIIPIAPKVVKNWNKSAQLKNQAAVTSQLPVPIRQAFRRAKPENPPQPPPITSSPPPTAAVIPVRPQETPSEKNVDMETNQQADDSLNESDVEKKDPLPPVVVEEEVHEEGHKSSEEPTETTSCETAVNTDELQLEKKPDPISIDPSSSTNDATSKLKLCTGVPNMRIPKRKSRPLATVPRLFDLCEKAAEKYARGAFNGRVPFSLLRPLLNQYDARKLYEVEITMPWLEDSITVIWKERLEKEFPSATLYPSETYGEAYRRCLEEKDEELEEKLIKAAMAVKKKTPKPVVEVKKPRKRRAPRGPSGENRSTRAKRAAKRA